MLVQDQADVELYLGGVTLMSNLGSCICMLIAAAVLGEEELSFLMRSLYSEQLLRILCSCVVAT